MFLFFCGCCFERSFSCKGLRQVFASFGNFFELFSDLCDLIGQEFSTDDMRTKCSTVSTVIWQSSPKSSLISVEYTVKYRNTQSLSNRLLNQIRPLLCLSRCLLHLLQVEKTYSPASNYLVSDSYNQQLQIQRRGKPARIVAPSGGDEMLSASSDEEPSNHQTFDTNTHLLRVTRLSLADFDITTLTRMVAALLNLAESKTQPLSELVHRRTHGNPCFVVEFLRSLESSGLLSFDNSTDVWRWELDRIQMETHVSDNVGELLLSRVQRLPSHIQSVLKVASCLGYKFDSTLLDNVLRNMSSFNGTTNPTESLRKWVWSSAFFIRRTFGMVVL